MNKKITAVTLTALMVLTLFTAMVPAASAVVIDKVSAPYEFIGAVEEIDGGNADFDLNSKDQPSILYFDFEEGEGKESLVFSIENTNKINSSTLVYSSESYDAGDDSAWSKTIAWLGQPYILVDSESDLILSKLLFDEDNTEDHLLKVGEVLTLPEGFSITVQEIDVDGKEAWFYINQDGEEKYSTVTSEGATFEYKEDLNDSAKKENIVLSFQVEVVFAGMNTNMVKINNTQLISLDVVKIESGDTDTINNYEIDFEVDDGDVAITIVPVDDGDDDTISLTKGGTKTIMDRFNIKINDDGEFAAVVKVVEVDGEEPTPTVTGTATPTATGDPNATATPTATGDPNATATPTATTTPEPTPTPTDVVGFEAVFAVAGLLAVAYLVMRQRE